MPCGGTRSVSARLNTRKRQIASADAVSRPATRRAKTARYLFTPLSLEPGPARRCDEVPTRVHMHPGADAVQPIRRAPVVRVAARSPKAAPGAGPPGERRRAAPPVLRRDARPRAPVAGRRSEHGSSNKGSARTGERRRSCPQAHRRRRAPTSAPAPSTPRPRARGWRGRPPTTTSARSRPAGAPARRTRLPTDDGQARGASTAIVGNGLRLAERQRRRSAQRRSAWHGPRPRLGHEAKRARASAAIACRRRTRRCES